VELVQTLIMTDNNQTRFLNKEVHRIFNQQFKRISVFANEQTYHDHGMVYLGSKTEIECSLTGHLLQGAYFMAVLPKITAPKDKMFAFCTNLGCSMVSATCKLGISNTALDYVNSQTNIILNNLFKRKDQRHYFNMMQGNTPKQTMLANEHESYKLIVPLKMFFADNPQKAFQCRRANINKVIFDI
jgi:hypothetical protein